MSVGRRVARLICGKRAVSSYACCECVCVCVVGVALRCVVHSFKKATLMQEPKNQEEGKQAVVGSSQCIVS